MSDKKTPHTHRGAQKGEAPPRLWRRDYPIPVLPEALKQGATRRKIEDIEAELALKKDFEL